MRKRSVTTTVKEQRVAELDEALQGLGDALRAMSYNLCPASVAEVAKLADEVSDVCFTLHGQLLDDAAARRQFERGLRLLPALRSVDGSAAPSPCDNALTSARLA